VTSKAQKKALRLALGHIEEALNSSRAFTDAFGTGTAKDRANLRTTAYLFLPVLASYQRERARVDGAPGQLDTGTVA